MGSLDDLFVDRVRLSGLSWVDSPVTGPVLVQSSAHGAAVPAIFDGEHVRFAARQRAVAPGQSVVLYDDDDVLGGGIAV